MVGIHSLKMTPSPFEMPRAVLVDTETGVAVANLWQIKCVLTRNLASQGQKTVYPDLRYPGLVLLWADARPNEAIGW